MGFTLYVPSKTERQLSHMPLFAYHVFLWYSASHPICTKRLFYLHCICHFL